MASLSWPIQDQRTTRWVVELGVNAEAGSSAVVADGEQSARQRGRAPGLRVFGGHTLSRRGRSHCPPRSSEPPLNASRSRSWDGTVVPSASSRAASRVSDAPALRRRPRPSGLSTRVQPITGRWCQAGNLLRWALCRLTSLSPVPGTVVIGWSGDAGALQSDPLIRPMRVAECGPPAGRTAAGPGGSVRRGPSALTNAWHTARAGARGTTVAITQIARSQTEDGSVPTHLNAACHPSNGVEPFGAVSGLVSVKRRLRNRRSASLPANARAARYASAASPSRPRRRNRSARVAGSRW